MKKTLMSLLLGTALVIAPVRGYAVDGKTQSQIFRIMAGLSLVFDTTTIVLSPLPSSLLPLFDVANEAIDALRLKSVKKRHTKWKGIPPSLQAQQRLIGNFEDLESYQEKSDYLTETDVHYMALTNTGIEALYGGGEAATDAATYSNEGMLALIQQQFGTPHITADISTDDTSALDKYNQAVENARQQAIQNATGAWATQDEIDTAIAEATKGMSSAIGTQAAQESLRSGYSDEEKALQLSRRAAHRQKVTTSGAARAELLQSVAATDNSAPRLSQLEGYVGKGESLSGQAKIYAGLELELAGRLNMLNVVQGNRLAVDAADALSRVE